MNKFLLTSLALFTFINYNSGSASDANITNTVVEGIVNLDVANSYNIIGTCEVKENGTVNASKPVSITDDDINKNGILKITGAESSAVFISGLTVNSGTVDMSNATGTTPQLHITDKLTL